MYTKIPIWIAIGGFMLTLIAGIVNVTGIVSFQHQAVSHLTGTMSNLSISLFNQTNSITIHLAGIIFSFFIGAVISNLIIRDQHLIFGKRYGFAFMYESIFLFMGYLTAMKTNLISDYLISMACGLQNAMATTFSGAVLRTTHVTGIVTDLGIAVGSLIRGNKNVIKSLKIHLTLLSGFIIGSTLGAFLNSIIGFKTLLIPTIVLFVSGLSYTTYRLIKQSFTTDIS